MWLLPSLFSGPIMNARSVIFEAKFLQAVIVLVGMVALAFLLWEPHLEGRNANATFYEVYFNDPFLAYAYVASFSFFFGLYHAFTLLGYAGANRLFSYASVRAVRMIRICAMAMIGFVVVGELIVLPSADEMPPPVFMGLVICFGAGIVAAATSMFEKLLQNEIGVASESSLTA